ncbi:hypothetical protein L596_004977 [Steinernema carpocapsae]|uniref:Uncharacterized protein n=1 Tax=Steinernema carpocapsae TaxID=34508 RepID=A0A4U8UYK8_STECR|nr:hypothetical protein L596_004977 [Steinernema carpocapsae]
MQDKIVKDGYHSQGHAFYAGQTFLFIVWCSFIVFAPFQTCFQAVQLLSVCGRLPKGSRFRSPHGNAECGRPRGVQKVL